VGVGLGIGVGVTPGVGVGNGICVGSTGAGEADATATLSGICELSKNILDSIFLITPWSNVGVIGSETSLGTLSVDLTAKAR